MTLYAAYGANMNRQLMHGRCGGERESIAVGSALLRNWQLEFRRGVLTVVPQPDAVVPLAMWRISELAGKSLDRFEGAPWLYARRQLPGSSIRTLSGDISDLNTSNFLIYEMTTAALNSIDQADAPAAAYFEKCRQGYADFGLQAWQHLLEAARERALSGAMQ